jgi:hypothetical protein
MLPRSGRIILTALLAIWLNAVVPGHTRGVITLPGGEGAPRSQCAAGPTRCCPKTGKPIKQDGGPTEPTEEEKSRCAVCFFAKGLSNHAGGVTALAPIGLLEVASVPAPQHVESAERIATYLGRAPPPA